MVRCVVKCCKNTRETCVKEQISFFQLPENPLMREGWIRKIGEIYLPTNIKNARICSAHFTEGSFLKGKRNRDKSGIRRRRLISSAVPTLFLSSTENSNSDTIRMNCKVIYNKFQLPVKKRMKEGSGSITEMDSGNEPIANLERSLQNDSVGGSSSVRENMNDMEASEYRSSRSLRKKTVLRSRNILHTSTVLAEKIPSKTASKRNMKVASKQIEEYASEEGTPSWKRKQRFIMENCSSNIHDSAPKLTTNDDPNFKIDWLKAELQHRRSVGEFHVMTKQRDFEDRQSIQQECDALKLQLLQKDEHIKNLMRENKELKHALNDLHAKSVTASIDKNLLQKLSEEQVKEILQPYFTEGQIRCIVERRKWVHWSIDDYASAISLRSVSPKAYTYLRLKLNYPLPSLATLRKWALKKFDIREGFLLDVLAVMREKGKELTSFEKTSVISFDEMSLSPEVCFDSKIEKLVGPCKKVQVIMVRGLFSKWKQPIYYKFDQQMTKDILIETVNHLYDAGYQVVAITCDMANKGVWGELNITPENHFFEHTVIKDAKIFVFADVPHLIKLLRNWFIDKGLLLPNCNEPFTAKVFQAIVDMNKDGDLHIAHRITQRILDARNSLRQAVRPAARLFSHTAAKAIKWAGERGILKVREYIKFSDFVSTVNNWFDVHNSQQEYGAHPGVNGFGVDIQKQEQSLVLMNLYVQNMKVCSKTKLMPFQKGILISNASLRGLYDQLKKTHEQQFQYLLTRRLQQDVLENFFAYIRAMGSCRDHPSGYEFRYRLRWYVLGKHSQAVFTMNRNTEEDVNTSCMSSYTAEDLSSISADSLFSSTPTIQKPSTAIASTSKQMCSSTPTRKINSPESTKTNSILSTNESINFECEEDNSEKEEIILTKELFASIINISPEELQQDYAYDNNNESILEDVDDDCNVDELFNFLQDVHFKNSTLGGENASQIIEEESLQYVAGYVAHRFKKKYPHLGERTDIASNKTTETNWIKVVSKGYLMYPSPELLQMSRLVDKCFNDFHGHYFSKEDYVIQKVVKLVQNCEEYDSCIPQDVLQCLVRTRTYIRVRDINARFYTESDKQKQNKKIKKLVLKKTTAK